MSKVEELLKDNKLAEKLSMAKLNDRFFTPDYLDDFDDEYDDEFDDDFFEDEDDDDAEEEKEAPKTKEEK